MSDRNLKTAIEQLSANVVGTQFEDFDDATVELAKNRILDVIGCAIGGVNAPGNAALANLIKNWGGNADASIWVLGIRTTAQNAAMANAILSRSYDFEVMSYGIDGQMFASHHAATNVPTAMALCEALDISGKELLTAMIVGDDVAARVQAASEAHPIGLGWDGCGTLSHLGATAVAGRLLNLNEHQMRNAFGIVLNQIASAIQSLWDGATSFKLGQGTAARNGIFSAELAKAGWTGVEDALQSRFGYFHLYAKSCKNPDILTKDLGVKYYGEAYFKPYPCGLPNHVAIKCALNLLHKYEINTEKIAEIVIAVPTGALQNSYYAKPFKIRDFPHGDAIFSYPYTVATTLLKKSIGLHNFTEKAILDPQVNRLTSITRLVEPPYQSKRLEITLKVILEDGSEFTESSAAKFEWMEKPIPRSAIEEKFWHQIDFSETVPRQAAEKLVTKLNALEEEQNLKSIMNLLNASSSI